MKQGLLEKKMTTQLEMRVEAFQEEGWVELDVLDVKVPNPNCDEDFYHNSQLTGNEEGKAIWGPFMNEWYKYPRYAEYAILADVLNLRKYKPLSKGKRGLPPDSSVETDSEQASWLLLSEMLDKAYWAQVVLIPERHRGAPPRESTYAAEAPYLHDYLIPSLLALPFDPEDIRIIFWFI